MHISFNVTISTAENSHAFFESEPYRNHGDKKDYKNVENLKVNIIDHWKSAEKDRQVKILKDHYESI